MRGIDLLAGFAPLDETPDLQELRALHNVERVRSYLERNLGCSKKEVIRALDLHPRTVAKAIKIIREKS